MANPKLLLEIGSLGLEKTLAGLKGTEVAAVKLAQAEKLLAGDRVRRSFAQQQTIVERLRSSLEGLRAGATAVGQGAMVGTAAASFSALDKAVKRGTLSQEQFNERATRTGSIISRTNEQVRAAIGPTEKLAQSTKKVGQASKKTVGETKTFVTSMKNLSSTAVLAIGPLSGLGARIVALGAVASRSNLQMALFLGVLAGGITGFIGLAKAAKTVEDDFAAIRGTLRATGKEAFLTAEGIRAIQEEFVALTPGGAIDDIQEATTVLLRLGNVGEAELQRLLGLSLDLEAAGFSSVRAGAEQLAQVLTRPESAIRSLNRVVPVFTSEITRNVREMVKLGRGAAASELIMKALDERIGGLAQDINVGLTAEIGSLQQEFRRLFEDLGKSTSALSVATFFVQKATGAVALLRENIAGVSLALVGIVSGSVATGFIGFVRVLGVTVSVTTAWITILAAAAVAIGFVASGIRSQIRIQTRINELTEESRKLTDDVTEALLRQEKGSEKAARGRISNLATQIADLEGQKILLEGQLERQRSQLEERIPRGVRAPLVGIGLRNIFARDDLKSIQNMREEIVATEGTLADLKNQRSALERLLKDVTAPGGGVDSDSEQFRRLGTLVEKIEKDFKSLNDLPFERGFFEELRLLEDGRASGQLALLGKNFGELERMLNAIRGDELIRSLGTPLQVLREELERLDTIRALANQTLQGEDLKAVLKEINLQAGEVNQRFLENDEVFLASRNAIESIGDTITDSLFRQTSALKAFGNLAKSIIEDIISRVVRLAIVNRLLNAFFPQLGLQTLFGGGGSGGSFGGSVGGFPKGAKGLAISGGDVQALATGGIVTKPTALIGEAGDEGILPLERIGGLLGVNARVGGGDVEVNVIDQRGANAPAAEVSESTGLDGKRQINVLIRDAVKDMMAVGQFDRDLNSNFGISRVGRR